MKQTLITEDRVMETVNKAIAETLRVKEDAVKPESSFVNDLGGESLDFIDLNYRIEQAFGIKMARGFIFAQIEELFGEGVAIDENGRLTEKAVRLLKIRFGESGYALTSGMDMDDVPALITVRSIVHGVMEILDTLPGKCRHCNIAAWKSDDGVRILCGSCGEYADFVHGDDVNKQWLLATQEEMKIF